MAARSFLILDPRSNVETLADLLARTGCGVLVNDRGHVVGQDHHRAKLSDHDVWLIHELCAERIPHRQIAAKFEVSLHTVKSISAGRRRAQTATDQRKST